MKEQEVSFSVISFCKFPGIVFLFSFSLSVLLSENAGEDANYKSVGKLKVRKTHLSIFATTN